MKPSEVHVIFNKYLGQVLYVFAEEFMAQNYWNYMVEHETDNDTPGMVSNNKKLVVCTLERALVEIYKEHLAQMDDLKEAANQVVKWGIY